MTKISPSRKPGHKNKPGARAPSWPSRHAQVRTGAPRRAHGSCIVAGSPAVSWQWAGRVAGPSGRIAASLPHASRASACALAPSAPVPAPARPAHLLRAQRRIVAAQPAVSWPCVRAGMAVSWPALRHSPSLLTIQVGQLYCNTLQPSANQYCNTISSLAYSSCNTIWAVAQLKSAQFFFFSFFIIIKIFFFHFFSSSWKNH